MDNIERFLKNHQHRHNQYSRYSKYHKMKNPDADYVYRAVYLKNIPPLKASKLDYQNIAEFRFISFS